MFNFQSSSGADGIIVGKLFRLWKFGRAQNFIFILAITTPLIFDTKLNSTDHVTFELHFPDIRVGSRSHKVADYLARG